MRRHLPTRILSLFLTLAMGLSLPASAGAGPELSRRTLRPLNVGLEEGNAVTEEIKARLLEDQAESVSRQVPTGLEEGRLSRPVAKWALWVLLGAAAAGGIYGLSNIWSGKDGIPPALAVPDDQGLAWKMFQQELGRIDRLNQGEAQQAFPAWTQEQLEAELARIDQWTEINGVPIEEIERRARPGEDADTGFLGRDDNLREVLKADRRLEFQLGKTHRWYAKHLKRITWLAQLVGQTGREISEMRYLGQPLRVTYMGTHGSQVSILNNPDAAPQNPDNWGWRHDLYITNLNNGLHVLVGGNVRGDKEADLIAYGLTGYIERYGFYEGGGRKNPYRVDPAVLDAILTGKPATEDLTDRETISEREFLDSKRQEQMEALLQAEKEVPMPPVAEEAFRVLLERLPPGVVRELLDLAKDRSLTYGRKIAVEYPEKYGFRYPVQSYRASSWPGSDETIFESFELLYPAEDGTGVLRLNLHHQIQIMEDYLKKLEGQAEPLSRPNPAAGLEEGVAKARREMISFINQPEIRAAVDALRDTYPANQPVPLAHLFSEFFTPEALRAAGFERGVAQLLDIRIWNPSVRIPAGTFAESLRVHVQAGQGWSAGVEGQLAQAVQDELIALVDAESAEVVVAETDIRADPRRQILLQVDGNSAGTVTPALLRHIEDLQQKQLIKAGGVILLYRRGDLDEDVYLFA